MNILFILDCFEKLTTHEDTTLAVMAQAHKRGHTVWGCHSDELVLESAEAGAEEQKSETAAVSLGYARKTVVVSGSTVTWHEEETQKIALNDMQVIFMRTDPPFNHAYLSTTYILSQVDKTKTLVVNSPEALRNYNEKLLIFEFAEYCAPTLVTSRKTDIRAFVEKHKMAVIKPLYSYGGHGVCILKDGDKNLSSITELVTKNGTEAVMVQKYIPEAEKGDIRAIALNGKILGYENRVRAKGEYRNNISSGGHLEQAKLTTKQTNMAEHIASQLPAKGIYFAGIDIIGDSITEINITSPTGIPTINKLENLHLETDVIDFFESYEKFLTR